MIQINPLQSYIDGGARAAITSPPSASLVFDLPGRATWVKGVKLKGTDHTYTFSHDNYITLTNTPGSDESEDIKIGVNITTLKAAIDTTYTTGTLAQLQAGTNTTAQVWTAKILAQYVTGSLPVTKNMTINGTAYAIFTTAASLPTFYAPATLGTAGQILSCTSSGLSWVNQTQNTDYRVTQSNVTANNNYRILLKKSANDTQETTSVNFASTLTYNPSTNELKVNGSKVIHTGNITSSNATIGEELTTIAQLGGVEIKAKVDYSNIIPSYLSQWDISVDKASFELTREWVDAGISLQTLSSGPCLLYINYCGVHYSGTFSYAGITINTDDEFPLHESGYKQLNRGRIFAKIAAVSGVAKLMLSASVPESNIPLFTIKIKQIAIL